MAFALGDLQRLLGGTPATYFGVVQSQTNGIVTVATRAGVVEIPCTTRFSNGSRVLISGNVICNTPTPSNVYQV